MLDPKLAQSLNLNLTMEEYAWIIARATRARGLPKRALVCEFMCVYQESHFEMYANENNPESLTLPHDKVGDDHGSVGLFQQQVGGAANSTADWGTTRELMDAKISADKFLNVLNGVVGVAGGWDTTRSNGNLVQAVQGSAFPDAYDAHEEKAKILADAVWDDAQEQPNPTDPKEGLPMLVIFLKNVGYRVVDPATGQANNISPNRLKAILATQKRHPEAVVIDAVSEAEWKLYTA